MASTAYFRFHGNLNDFLPKNKKNTLVAYSFWGTPSVKDAIESLGVPHVEAYKILINDHPSDFSTLIKDQDLIQVFPSPGYEESMMVTWPYRFVLDVHLGKLARLLRLTGFDTVYENHYNDHIIAEISASENRMVLSRDIGLLKHKKIQYGYWLRSQDPETQLKEIIDRFRLKDHFKPFSRCIKCNGIIASVPKEEVMEALPTDTKLVFNEFFQCKSCRQVYWEGSHYERMLRWIKEFGN